MAGVGFELRKLFNKTGIISSLGAYCVSGIVTEGPMLLCVVMLFSMRKLITVFHGSYSVEELFLVTITYSMIFSLLLSNSVLMFVSRYISDCIYQKKHDQIMSAFFGTSIFLLIVGGVISMIFVNGLELDPLYKVLAVTQFSLLLILWTQLTFLSAVKNYLKIFIGFFVSTLLSLGVGFVLMYLKTPPLYAALSGTTIGFFSLTCFFMIEIYEFYPKGKIDLLGFLPALDKYKILIAIGFLLIVGLYSHNFVIWTSNYSTKISNSFIYCIKYDIPTFYASLTMLPSLVMFVVALEVNFFEKYSLYLRSVMDKGNLQDIKSASLSMFEVLFREIGYLVQFQLLFTIFSSLLLAVLLSYTGLDNSMVGIFRILCFGYCFYGFHKTLVLMLLYFDDRKGALCSSLLFVVISTGLTYVLLQFGIDYFGVGFFAASIISSVFSYIRLYVYMKKINYHIFCTQPVFPTETRGFFTKLCEKIAK